MVETGLFENGDVLFAKQEAWKSIGVKGLTFGFAGGSVVWTNGTLYVNGTAYAILVGSSSSPLNKLITIVLNPSNYTGIVYFRTSTYVIPSNQEMQIGFCDAYGNLVMRYGITATTSVSAGFGGDGSDGVFNSTGPATITGIKNYTSFKVNNGHTITVNPYAIIKCSGNFEIETGGILKADGVITDSKQYSSVGIGVLSNAPIGLRESTRSNEGIILDTGGGGGLGRGGNMGMGYAGNRVVGLEIIKKQRGWFAGSPSCSGENGGGAILIECLGTVTIAGTISATGVDMITGENSGGGGGCIGILSVGNVNCAGGTVNVKGGDGTQEMQDHSDQGGGGGGAFLLVTEGLYTPAATVNISGGTCYSSYEDGVEGGFSITYYATPQFCRIPWVLG